MVTTTIIGLISGAFTTVSLIPQIVKIIKTKDTKSISLPMYIIYTTGIVGWLIYMVLCSENLHLYFPTSFLLRLGY